MLEEGNPEEALVLCREGLQRYPDSFLFYMRAAKTYDHMNRHEDAEQVLLEGMQRSRSKCSLAAALGDRAAESKDHGTAIRWWINACVLQLQANSFAEMMPFLKLAVVAEELGMHQAAIWLKSQAERANRFGPIVSRPEHADWLAEAARGNVAEQALATFYDRYI